MAISVKEDWLATTREEVIDPEQRIIDPHQHFFAPGGAFPHYDLQRLRRDASGHRVEKTVFIQCWESYRPNGPDELKPVGETEWVDEIARSSPKGSERPQIAGIVGAAELRLGREVRAVIDAHQAASALFRGIRQMAPWDASPAAMSLGDVEEGRLFLNDRFREGAAVLQDMGVVYETWIYHPHIRHLASLAKALPDLTIVLDHTGSPLGIGRYADRRAEVFKQWSEDMGELSRYPNVYVKLGGMAMPWQGFAFEDQPRPPTSDAIVNAHRGYYEHVIEKFGASRCMFEGNFPIEKNAVSYDVLWNAFKKIASGCSPEERDDLFYGTAARVYRI